MGFVWGIVIGFVIAVSIVDYAVKRRERYWRARRKAAQEAALEYLRRVHNAPWN